MRPSTCLRRRMLRYRNSRRILAGIAEDAAAVLARLFFAPRYSKKDYDIRDNYPNYPAFTGPEAARRIGFVIQLFNGLIDPGGDFGTDVSGLVDHMGDSAADTPARRATSTMVAICQRLLPIPAPLGKQSSFQAIAQEIEQ